jgi:hypothetical protein
VLRSAELRSGLRRLSIVFGVIFALTSAISLAIGAIAHANLSRALGDGFYLAGAAVLIGSFALGMRGPLRAEWGEGRQGGAGQEVDMPLPRAGFMPRLIRRTTRDERMDARKSSLALFALGLVLILIGAGFDPSRNAF